MSLQSGLAALLLVAAACGEEGPAATGTGAGTGTDGCDTETPPATSGGRYSPQWGGFDTDDPTGGSSSTGAPSTPPEEDPTAWTYSATHDVYYRSPTDQELVDRPWLRSDQLFVLPKEGTLEDLEDLDASVTIALPLHDRTQSRPQEDLEFVTNTIAKMETRSSVPFIEKNRVSTYTHLSSVRVTFGGYVTSGFDPGEVEPDDLVVFGYASATRRSLALSGVQDDRQFWLNGPFSDSQVELEIPFPSGTSIEHLYILSTSYDPAPGSLLPVGGGAPLVRGGPQGLTATSFGDPPAALTDQCADELDNDRDCFFDDNDFMCVEHPDFGTDRFNEDVAWETGKNIGMFGDASYCAFNGNAYLTDFIMKGDLAVKILDWVRADDNWTESPSSRPPPFRVVLHACVFPDDPEDVDAAVTCDDGGTCSGGLDGYPWAGYSGTWNTLIDLVWDLVDFTVDANVGGTDLHPIQFAVAFPLAYDDSQGEAGLGTVYSASSPGANGASLVRGDEYGRGTTVAHEIGHSLGIAHDNSVTPQGYPSFMMSFGGVAPVLDWDAVSDVGILEQGQIYEQQAPLKEYPRPSGFKHVGCDDPGTGDDDDQFDCADSEHPDLSCVDDYCRP